MKKVHSQEEFERFIAAGEFDFVIVGFRATLRENSQATLRDFTTAIAYNKNKISKGIYADVIFKNINAYPSNVRDWCAMKGIKIKNNRIQLYKAVSENGLDFYTGKINYLVKNKDIIDPQWDIDYTQECGRALHLADSPEAARGFVSDNTKYRMLLVSANIDDCRCFGGSPDYPQKLRARACRLVRELPEESNL